MLKKILCLVIVLAMSISVIGCGKSTEEIRSEIDVVYDMIDETNKKCDYLAIVTYDHWKSSGLEWLFEKNGFDEVSQYFNDGFKSTRSKVHTSRDTAKNNLNEIKTMLKEITPNDETQGYYDAIEDLYVNVNTYYSFAAEYPAGYSKVTFINEIMEHQERYEELASRVELER